MEGILWSRWILNSITAQQSVNKDKPFEIHCNLNSRNWRNKEDDPLKIKEQAGLVSQAEYVVLEDRHTLSEPDLNKFLYRQE